MDSYRKLVKNLNGAAWEDDEYDRLCLFHPGSFLPSAFTLWGGAVSGTTLTDFLLTVIGGILGGLAVGKAMKEHSLGSFVDAVAGAAGAVLGSLLLRLSLEQTTLQAVVGAVEGGILALGIAIAKMIISEHSQK